MGDENNDGPQWSHLLVSSGYLEDVQHPIMSSSRIKYTCLSVSKQFIALGSSTGVVHIFLRDSLRYVQLIAGDKDGSVVKIKIGPDESTVGFATSKGMVYVYLLKMDRRTKPEKLRSTNDHRGAVVTSMVWNDQGNRLFIGDDFGKMTAANIITGAKDIFKTPSELIMKLDKPIVQIDSFNDLILISTTERTFIGNSSKQQYTHIGSKLRDGHFGACFWRPVTSGGDPMIYCSRPGSRIWEATTGGRVLNTHQFKNLLAVPPLPMVNLNSSKTYDNPVTECAVQSIAFPQLSVLRNRHLITLNDGGLYIFDPVEVKVVLWNEEFKNAEDWSCYHSMVYILDTDGKLHKVELVQISKVVSTLVKKEKWKLAAQLCLTFKSTICCANSRYYVPVAMVTRIQEQMEKEGWNELADGLTKLLPMLEDFSLPESQTSSSQSSRRSSASYEMTESGIYVVKNKQETPPLYSQKVFSFLNQAEKYLDKAWSSGTENGLENTDNTMNNIPQFKESHNGVFNDLQDTNNSASNGVLNRDLPELQVNTMLPIADPDVVDPANSADEDAEFLETRKDSEVEMPAIHVAIEAQSFEDTADDEAPVISKRNVVRQKSKGKKVKASRIVLENDENMNTKENREDSPLCANRINDGSTDLSENDRSSNGVAEALNIHSNSSILSLLESNDVLLERSVENGCSHDTFTGRTANCGVAMTTHETLNLLEAKTIATREESPRRGLLRVKDKLSGTVKTKTKSLIQTIKDKKSQISPRLRHKSSEDMATLVFHKDGENDNYFIQEPKRGTMSADETKAEVASDFLENPDIESVTRETHQSLQHLCNVSDPDKMKKMLSSWVNVLHRTLFWHRNHAPLLENKEPVPLNLDGIVLVTDFSQGPSESDAVSQDASENNDIEKSPDDLQGQTSDELVVSNSSNIDTDDDQCWGETKPEDPKVIISLHDSTCIPMDLELQAKISELACFCFEMEIYGEIQSLAMDETSQSDSELFLRTYYHLLEPRLTRIWRGLQKKQTIDEKWKSLFACIKDAIATSEVMLKIDQANSQEIVELLATSMQQMGPELLVYLESLYKKEPSAMVQFAAKEAKNLVSKPEVKHIIDSHHFPEKGKYFCKYLENYIEVEDKVERSKLLREILLDLEMTLTWFENLLLQIPLEGAGAKMKCSCGMPRPEANKIKWKSEDLMLEIVNANSCSSELIELCYKHGFWKGYLTLWSHLHQKGPRLDKTQIFPIVLHLGDLKVFDDFEGIQPSTVEDWRNLLLLFQQSHCLDDKKVWQICLKCRTKLKPIIKSDSESEKDSNMVSWENVCHRMLESLGPEAAITLLSDSTVAMSNEEYLPIEFYTKCVTAAHLKQQQRQIIHKMMEKIHSSETPSSRNAEQARLTDTGFSDDGTLPPNKETPEVESQKLQQFNSEKNCEICGLGLMRKIHHLNSNVMDFTCGHSFHDCCIGPHEVCPACD